MLRRRGDKTECLGWAEVGGGRAGKRSESLSPFPLRSSAAFLQAQSRRKGKGGSRSALRKNNVNTEEKRCLSASLPFFFFLEIKYLLDCLFFFFFSFTSAQPFCLLPTSPCLPVFQGKRSPQLPSPPSLVCRVGASSARPLNDFHMALQAAVSAQDTQHTPPPPPQKSDTHRHSPKVQRSLPADLENATVWKWSLAQSKHPTPSRLSARLPCVKQSAESGGRMHTNAV